MDNQAAIEEILVEMEDELEQAKTVPLSDKVFIDREKFYEMITRIRLNMPNEIEQSRWVLDEKERIIEDARHTAKLTLADAEEQRAKLVDESEVTQAALAQAETIVGNAESVAKEIKMGAREYASDLLTQMQEQMKQLTAFAEEAAGKYRDAIEKQSKSLNDEFGKFSESIGKQSRTLVDEIGKKAEIVEKNRLELSADR